MPACHMHILFTSNLPARHMQLTIHVQLQHMYLGFSLKGLADRRGLSHNKIAQSFEEFASLNRNKASIYNNFR
jgi:hypothetical protein